MMLNVVMNAYLKSISKTKLRKRKEIGMYVCTHACICMYVCSGGARGRAQGPGLPYKNIFKK